MAKIIHRKRYTRAYQVWVDMLARCRNPARQSYPRYGGRGISVCSEWLKFENFYADMGDPPKGMSIDRIDNDGNYQKSNCRWATRFEQALNRSISRFVLVDGERINVIVAARRYGIPPTTLKARLDAGWPDDIAAKKPLRKMARQSEWVRQCG